MGGGACGVLVFFRAQVGFANRWFPDSGNDVEFLIPVVVTKSEISPFRILILRTFNSGGGNLLSGAWCVQGGPRRRQIRNSKQAERQTASAQGGCCKIATRPPFLHVAQFREFLFPVVVTISVNLHFLPKFREL